MTGQTLRTIRKRLGLTQVQFAKHIGVTANTVARWERGEIGMRPMTERLIKLLAQTSDLTTGETKK